MAHEHYLPILLAAFTVLILGCANFRAFQSRTADGKPSGYPSSAWLASLALLVGLLSVWLYNNSK